MCVSVCVCVFLSTLPFTTFPFITFPLPHHSPPLTPHQPPPSLHLPHPPPLTTLLLPSPPSSSPHHPPPLITLPLPSGVSTPVAQSRIQECLSQLSEADYNCIMSEYKVCVMDTVQTLVNLYVYSMYIPIAMSVITNNYCVV